MDTSYWTALNPDIQRLNTRKLMHGKYPYRLAIEVIGCSILRRDGDLDQEIKHNNASRAYNWAGSWRRRPIRPDDAELLRVIKAKFIYNDVGFRLQNFPDVKIRVEEPNLQFYATSMEELQKVASALAHVDNKHFISVMYPTDANTERMLLEGYTLRKKSSEWPYKILFRNGRYSQETKKCVKEYLTNIEDHVKVPPNLWVQLEKPGWIWGGYVYVKDSGLATMLHMIDGRLVSKVEEYKTMDSAL